MTEEQIREKFRAVVEEAGGGAAWARLRKVTRQYVSDVLGGRRPPGPLVLAAVGMVKETEYRPAPNTSPSCAALSAKDVGAYTSTANRVSCSLQLDRTTNDAELLAWAKRWREPIRALLQDRPL